MYLTIITTILVLTQIIRVTQNAIQLKSMAQREAENQAIVTAWEEMKASMDGLADVLSNLNP